MVERSSSLYRKIILVFLLVFSGLISYAQYNPSVLSGRLSTGSELSTFRFNGFEDDERGHSPKKATIMSAVIPGLGQAYNDKYWKIGIIYAGFTGLGIGYKINNDSMKRYQKALDYRVDGDTNTTDVFYPLLSETKIKQERNYYRSNRDRIIIGIVALYALQIIDANVDAHLKEFEINKELSFKVAPHLNYVPLGGLRPSLSLSLSF